MKIRLCINCKKDFKPTTHNQLNCSPKCREIYGKEYLKKYYQENSEKIKELNKKYLKEQRKNPQRRINDAMSNAVRRCLNGQKNFKKWQLIIGFSSEELTLHLKKQFETGMSMKNYGKVWHIDHRIPLSWFKFTSSDDPVFKKAWNLNNLKPMFALDNIKKGNRYSESTLEQALCK